MANNKGGWSEFSDDVIREKYPDGGPAADAFLADWFPAWTASPVRIGNYRTAGAAKGACKRYAKRMAAAFKAMGRAGWQ